MAVEIKRVTDRLVIRGVLNFANANDVWRRSQLLLQPMKSPWVIDLQGVQTADSTGVALLVEWLKLSNCLGKAVEFSQIPKRLQLLLDVSGLSRII